MKGNLNSKCFKLILKRAWFYLLFCLLSWITFTSEKEDWLLDILMPLIIIQEFFFQSFYLFTFILYMLGIVGNMLATWEHSVVHLKLVKAFWNHQIMLQGEVHPQNTWDFLFIPIEIVNYSCFTLAVCYTWISFLLHLICQNQLEPWKI